MKSATTNEKIFVGVDVSKATLDVYRPDTKEVFKINNSDEAIALLCSRLKKMKRKVVVPQPMVTKSDHELKHGALVARRNQLLELVNQENNRLKQSWDDDAKQSIRDVLETLKKQLKTLILSLPR